MTGDNLVGALIVLIIFGFIFKIDSIIRTMFNFVGGSTKIKTSRSARSIAGAASILSDTAGSGSEALSVKIGDGAESISNKVSGFGRDISQTVTDYRINKSEFGKEYARQNIQTKFKKLSADTIDRAKKLPGKALDKTKDLTGRALDGAIEIGEKAWSGAKEKANEAIETAKDKAREVAADAKDLKDNYREIFSGERVKRNLTADEIVRQQHIMDEARGLEGIRQGIQRTGDNIRRKTRNSLRNSKTIYNKADLTTKKKIKEITDELKSVKSDVSNDIETVKRIPKIIKKVKKKQKFVKNSENLNVDVSNTMMLVVDTNANINEIVPELKQQLGKNISASVFMFNKVGAQTFLSSELGSSRLGLSVLAEDIYEDRAENRLNEAITNKKSKKRRIRKT